MLGSRTPVSRGLLASVGSSLAFAGVYFVTPMLSPASAEAVWGIRNLIAIPMIALALLAVRQWHLATEIVHRVRRTPLLALGILACGFLVAAQLWVFSWAPLHGRGLQVALGYFLLPLVLVIIGRFLYKDRLVWWQWLAAGIAAIGVVFELIRVGGVSWETLLVALGYPVYFVLRRALGTAHLGGMFWEFVSVSLFALAFLVREIGAGTSTAANPALWWAAPLFAVWTGIALMLYISASRLLTMSVFGLVSYLEPALLVVASLLNGERIGAEEWVIYGAVWASVTVLLVGGCVALVRDRRSRQKPPQPDI
ncbi:EamA family transporter RarD [Leucobacter luti]|uniref:Chloramphenicol-sensitive protein RarD n=1 Tax=Leucobacter luti TaxID=340320 RepID=A0A4R6RV71_9MICO|nr:EamA family transporter RarD [Leucobacter luti]QYM77160.1 EamA family transporter RarD [Leucobacter luti]TDP90833.1 chloramphenicol-sensitive protein RarD [Leucobacter luti]